ncbi:MAG: sulfatase-like hydrolase/transferase [Clostridia bacterium]|nr:sulfatase-like hydrolase/transferase [Clostridia bacterium]
MNTAKVLDTVSCFFTAVVPKILNIIKNFFVNNFEIKTTKKSKITGASVAAVLLLVVVFFNAQFTKLETGAKWWLFAFALIAPFIIGLFIAFTTKIKNALFDKIWHFVFFMLIPIVTMTMTECLNNIFIYNMTYLGFFANYMVILLFQFLIFAICGSFKVSILTVNAICYGFALAHCYVVNFRGTPFIPMDFFAITTAANVANTYNYTPTHTIIIGTLIFIFIVVLGIKMKTPAYNLITKIVSRTFMGTFFACLMCLFYFTSIFADAGVKPDFWNQSRGYRNYGFVFSFFCNTKYLYMSEPNGYDANSVGDYVSSTVEKEETNIIKPTGNEPNIICIMNESLSDLSFLGEFTTNEDYMPFMRSLTENTVKGNLYVPVIGAGTSNTEFEFLTGHSTAFLPSGSNAYMLYVKNPLASLVSTLEGQGYSSWAFHPYYSTGWNRVSVYENLGFNSYAFLENLIDVSILNDYTKNGSDAEYLQSLIDTYYPDRNNMLLRQYVSDSYNYDVIIDNYENRDKSKPYFAFNVTMQNHGGYSKGASNFEEKIQITSTNTYYNKANRYLSLVKASDDAFKNLIEYFSNVDEPTVICMFGDHQPSIETDFIASLLGVSNINSLSIEQEQARHVTPFFIWANFDIEEKQIDKLSANYLSSYVLDIAGVKLTEYNKYLLKLSETLPVIDTVGYIDTNNNYYKWSDKSEYTEILSEYEKIQYNNIFDSEHKDNEIFFLEGYVMPETLEDGTEETEQ